MNNKEDITDTLLVGLDSAHEYADRFGGDAAFHYLNGYVFNLARLLDLERKSD